MDELIKTAEQIAYHAAAGVLGAFLAWLKTRGRAEKAEQGLGKAKDEVRNLRTALAYREGRLIPVLPYPDQQQIDNELQAAAEYANVARTALFFACNGEMAPTEVSSLWVRNHAERESDYYRRTIDGDYAHRLSDMAKHGHCLIETSKTPADSLIGGIYRDVGVIHSLWVLLYRDKSSELGIAGYVFMSWSKFIAEPFTDSEIRRIVAACSYKAHKMLDAKEGSNK